MCRSHFSAQNQMIVNKIMKWESVASNYLRRLYNLSFPTFSKTYNGLVVV